MTRKTILTALLGLASLSTFAQLNSSVSVEGEYEPLVIETERLNVFPQGYRFDLPATALSYELQGIVTDFRPDLLTMGVTGRQTAWPWDKRRGFVDFRLGSYLNSRLHAGYYVVSDSVNTLLADLQFRSSSLYRIHGVPADFTKPARKRLYDGTLGLHYSRLVGAEGLLKADASYRIGYFNYYGTTVEKSLLPAGDSRVPVPSQTVNQAQASVGYVSSPSTVKGWHAEAAVDYLGYRRLYGPVLSGESSKGDRETQLTAGAGYAFNFADLNAVAVNAKGDFLFYSEPKDWLTADSKRKNYGVVSLTPSYRYAGDRLSLRAGVDLAVSYGVMGYEPDNAKFHVAPDVDVQYLLPAGIGLFASATGGVMPSTLQWREQYDRYQMPYMLWNQPIYTPLDARLGINAGSFAGFTGSFALRYVIAKNIPLGGWYQDYLGAYAPGSGDFLVNFLTPRRQTVNLSGYTLELGLQYAFGNMVELGFKGSYTPQDKEDGVFNGFDRPRWVLDAKAAVRPVRKLRIEVGYVYRGVRNCYSWAEQKLPGIQPDLIAFRLPDITDLNAKVTYSLLDNLDIYCRGENLLNRRVDILPGLQSEGLVVSGGLYFEF